MDRHMPKKWILYNRKDNIWLGAVPLYFQFLIINKIKNSISSWVV